MILTSWFWTKYFIWSFSAALTIILLRNIHLESLLLNKLKRIQASFQIKFKWIDGWHFFIFHFTIISLLLLATTTRVTYEIIAPTNQNRVICGTELCKRSMKKIIHQTFCPMNISLNDIVWFDNFISTECRMYDYKTFMGLMQGRILYKLEYNNF